MVKITTRGGVAKTLEYDLNTGLISVQESELRIIILLSISGILLLIFIQSIMISLFGIKNPIILPALESGTGKFFDFHLQSISIDGNVTLFSVDPRMQSINEVTVRQRINLRAKVSVANLSYVEHCMNIDSK